MSNLGVSIDLNESIFNGGALIRSLNGELSSYSDTKSALGGYDKASFTLAGDIIDLEDWYENGLGRDIVTYDEAQAKIFNGFINKISMTIGGRNITRGPLMDVSNKLAISFSPLDTTVTPPVAGAQTLTDWAGDLISQGRYGILEEVFSADRVTRANAINIRDNFLAERKNPETTETLSSESSVPSISVEVLGYKEYLNRYFYSSVATGTVNISAKIQTILAADPNAIFTADYSGITANTLQTASAETSARAWEIIKGEVAKGNASSSRYLCGVYNNRKVFYNPIPTTFDYQYSVTEGKMEYYGGGEIMPWDILPGKWLFYTNFLAGKTIPAAVREDPRALFIEAVTFTAPFGFSISGGKITKTSQIMAQLGLGGAA